jgi:hypothetical protein
MVEAGSRPTKEPLRYLSLELGEEGVAEIGEDRRVVFVPRADITGLELRRGIAGERPVLQVVVGFALIALGLSMLGALQAVLEGFLPRTSGRIAGGGAACIAVGAYILWTGLRPAHYLWVRSSRDARKVLILGRVDLGHLAEILAKAKLLYGYEVAWQVKKPGAPDARPYR